MGSLLNGFWIVLHSPSQIASQAQFLNKHEAVVVETEPIEADTIWMSQSAQAFALPPPRDNPLLPDLEPFHLFDRHLDICSHCTYENDASRPCYQQSRHNNREQV